MVFGRGGGDGRLFTCSKDGTIKVWAAGGTGPDVLLQTLTEHTNIVCKGLGTPFTAVHRRSLSTHTSDPLAVALAPLP